MARDSHRETPSPADVSHLLEFDKGHPILDSIADGVFTVDPTGNITSFNRAAEEMTGYTREEAIGRRCSEVFKANICKHQCALQRSVESGNRRINVPVEITRRNGQRLPISVSTAVLRDRKGRHVGGVETFRDLSEVEELRRQIDDRTEVADIVGNSPRLREVLEILPEVAVTDATVLIRGPSGTGKGLLAAALHNLSHRKDGPLIKVNCAALPETLLESELFGYMRGAFTDARKDKPGRIALAEGGTIFLDEIGDVTPAVQVKLLRVVQDREYEPLGSTHTEHADVRVVAATNRDLERMMREGTFREDLFYRLNIVDLELPSLAERREDIPRLVDRFLRRFNAKMGKSVATISDEAMALLLAHDYPGNVRELENAIEHALVLCREHTVEPRHLPTTLRNARDNGHDVRPNGLPLQSAEARAISETLQQCKGNRSEAARQLGLHRTTLWRKMRRYGLA